MVRSVTCPGRELIGQPVSSHRCRRAAIGQLETVNAAAQLAPNVPFQLGLISPTPKQVAFARHKLTRGSP